MNHCGAAPRRISNSSEIKMVGFIAKPTIFVSLRGRRAAVAILKPKVWHPVAKHRSGKRQNPQISDRRGATPQRRFSGSAISRGRTPAFPVRSIFHTIKDRISPRSHTRPTAEFHRAASPRFALHFPVASAPSACYTYRAPRQNFLSFVRYSCIPCVAMIY